MVKRGDLIVVGIIILVALVAYGYWQLRPWDSQGAEIIIEVEGRQVAAFPLVEEGRDRSLDVRGLIGITTVRMDGNRVRVTHSDCPDKICVHMGWIDRPGFPIACLPNRVLVQVRGEIDDFDFITK